MVAVVLGAACGNEPGGPGLIPDIALDTVLTGLDHPLYVTPPPGDHNRLFVVERPGTIRIIKSGVLRRHHSSISRRCRGFTSRAPLPIPPSPLRTRC
jgi:hypothetical protein